MHNYIVPVTSSVVIGLMVLMYLHERARTNILKNQVIEQPVNYGDVDVTRWAHDGSQPTYWSSGNTMKVPEPIVKELLRDYF